MTALPLFPRAPLPSATDAAARATPPLTAPVELHSVVARDPTRQAFANALLNALTQTPHRISPKFFYDQAGSALFEKICMLPEYYPTRTELQILSTHAADMARCIGPRADIIEFGAGASRKIGLLLGALVQPLRYTPIDISGEHLAQAVAALQRSFPDIVMQPVTGDFTQAFNVPAPLAGATRVGFFPGSTLGNFNPPEALAFLRRAASLLRGGGLLLGIDLVKEPARLHTAYNDAAQVTAEFNLNLLRRANRELGADFDLTGFAHHAPYDPVRQRVDMYLVSRRPQAVRFLGREFFLKEGDCLHTESSHKYTVEGLRRMATEAGFTPGPVWCDPERLFSVHWLRAPPADHAVR